MRIIMIVNLLIFISLVFISLAEDMRGQQNAERLTVTTMEVKAKEISDNLIRLHKDKDIHIIEQTISNLISLQELNKPNTKEWPAVRRTQAELWFRLHEAVEKEIDKNFDFNSTLYLNISVPGPYPSGTAPESIKEPELRKEYEKAFEENRKKINERNFQCRLRKINKELTDRLECFLTEAYSLPPSSFDELKEMMAAYKIDEEVKGRILRELSQRLNDNNSPDKK